MSKTIPVRVQRKRTKGFILSSPNDLDVVCVNRGTKWDNPYKIGDERFIGYNATTKTKITRELALELFEKDISKNKIYFNKIKKELKNKNLACFCDLNVKCHADILLRIANED